VNKQRLINVLRDKKTLTTNEISELKNLSKSYPYSQIFHVLIAKGSYGHALPSAQKDLHMAAMYIADRTLLKTIMTEGSTIPDRTIITKNKPSTYHKTEDSLPTKPLSNSEGDLLRAEVLKNLEILIENKKHFQLEEDIDLKKATSPKTKTTKETKKTTTTKSKISKESKSVITKTKKVASNKSESKKDAFNQINIIDDFIKKQPSISRKLKQQPASKQPQKDLSEPSASFGEDLISENLAQILVKQGQNDKAIDIYKKLIWKFPQKKAYFATRIEELKK